MTDKPTYKAGDKVTIVLDAADAQDLNTGGLRLPCYDTDQIIKYEPAPEPKKWELWVAVFKDRGRLKETDYGIFQTREISESYAKQTFSKILAIKPVTLVEGEGL